jgi:predicted chitinase
MSNKVIYIEDPNSVNINNDMINSIAEYQDMHIDVSLSAIQKERSLITTMGDLDSEETFQINFLGYNQNKSTANGDDPNLNRFTTNYYDGSVDSSVVNYESFGITKINVKVNSSFVPVIKIEFTDIRGLSFFNQKDSPYRVLFNYPPPIFKLRIKGHYGGSLEYLLHLVKYTTEFKSENGNFIIDAEFIPLTFAPLTDILFRYITNAPILGDNELITSREGEEPNNSIDLIRKIRKLGDKLPEAINDSKENKEYEETINFLKIVEDNLDGLRNYKTANPFTSNSDTPLLFVADRTISPSIDINDIPKFKQLDSLSDYDSYFKLQGNKLPNLKAITDRLYIGYKTNIPFNSNNFTENLSTSQSLALTKYASTLNSNIEDLNIDINKIYAKSVNLETDVYIPVPSATTLNYIAIDITDYYISLVRLQREYEDKSDTLNEVMNAIRNEIVNQTLGFNPTIENVFRILLTDVDEFFNVMRSTGINAERVHHEKYKNEILNNAAYKDKPEKIYAYPLVVDRKQTNCTTTEVKVSPEEISEKLPEPFPELTLVYDFIESFNKIKELNDIESIITQRNTSDNINTWIPINILDSELNPDTNQDNESPYRYVNLMTANGWDAFLEVFLTRFYVLTQYTIPNKFYGSDINISNAYQEYFSQAEAANIALTITDTLSSNQILTKLDAYIGNINNFYDDLNSIKGYDSLDSSEYMYYGYKPSTGTTTNITNGVYISKNNIDYNGVFIVYGDVGVQDIDTEGTGPLSEFKKNTETKVRFYQFWKWGENDNPEEYHEFSSQNLLIAYDKNEDDDENLYSNYLTINPSQPQNTNDYTSLFNTGHAEYKSDIKELDIVSFPELWGERLSWISNRTNIRKVITGSTSTDEKLLMIFSNFGGTLSPYSNITNAINERFFRIPSIITTRYFLVYYVGLLIELLDTIGESGIKTILDDNFRFYHKSRKTRNADVYGFGGNIARDCHDILNYLSDADKAFFRQEYLDFRNQNSASLISKVEDLLNITVTTKKGYDGSRIEYQAEFENLLSEDNGTYRKYITDVLMEQVKLGVTNENVFSYSKPATPNSFIPLTIENNSNNKKTNNDKFFNLFFNALKKSIENKKSDILEGKTNDRITQDDDIVNQTYYSFKNINDKWLTNPINNSSTTGYCFCKQGETLFDLFAFVDRAMNDIGDTVINVECLPDLYDDPNISIFSVLSQLLSINNFEFFPLQNFLVHDQNSWNRTFKIDTNGTESHRAFFVCMYLGGSSSYFSDDSGEYPNDTILDISTVDSPDFTPCTGTTTTPQKVINNNVFAFNVLFAQQNQSMFKDMKIQSKDYPETNESIEIMSRLAGDNKDTAPPAKAQNLYNVYENRAYSATITGLGNAMIQPTQYFQLSNVPMYSGAYMILDVEHNIVPNNMVTTFTGTKVGRYPIPRVTQAYADSGANNVLYKYYGSGNGKYKISLPNDKVGEIAGLLKLRGITNKFTVAAMIGIAYKESGLVPQSEMSYKNNSNESLVKIFTCRVRDLSNSELTTLKKNDEKFFDRVYGKDIPSNCKNGNYGNTATGDGWKYRGRGLNQITFKDRYKQIGDAIGVDLVNNPDKLNEFTIAAKAFIEFYLSEFNNHKSIMRSRFGASNINNFTDLDTAYQAMYNINAGLGNDTRYIAYTSGKAKGRSAAENAYNKL